MKFTKLTHLMVLALALTVAGSGCRKGPQKVTVLPSGSRTGLVTDAGPGDPLPGSSKIGGENVGGRDLTKEGAGQGSPESHVGWPENAEIFKAYTVHFAFDSSVVKSSEASNVRSVADHLKSNPAQAVRVEGHCDERGTEEYNRALGERRALAIRDELIQQGIAPTRVDTISYGKDRPEDPGHNEAAHSKNRRGVFILLSPPSA
jgi:peptidoglycan-associated lipoprotein